MYDSISRNTVILTFCTDTPPSPCPSVSTDPGCLCITLERTPTPSRITDTRPPLVVESCLSLLCHINPLEGLFRPKNPLFGFRFEPETQTGDYLTVLFFLLVPPVSLFPAVAPPHPPHVSSREFQPCGSCSSERKQSDSKEQRCFLNHD